MVKASCRRCKGSAEGSTFEEASSKINHAVGLGRSIPCGASYGCVFDDSPKTITPPKVTPQPKNTTKSKDKTPKKTISVKNDSEKDTKEEVKDVVEKVTEDVAKDVVAEKSQAVKE